MTRVRKTFLPNEMTTKGSMSKLSLRAVPVRSRHQQQTLPPSFDSPTHNS